MFFKSQKCFTIFKKLFLTETEIQILTETQIPRDLTLRRKWLAFLSSRLLSVSFHHSPYFLPFPPTPLRPLKFGYKVNHWPWGPPLLPLPFPFPLSLWVIVRNLSSFPPPSSFKPIIPSTMVKNKQESRRKYWVTHSSIRLCIHSYTCSALLTSLACYAALTRLLARSFTPELVGK